MSFICHIHNYTEYNEWNVFSAFNPSKCTHLEQWAADCAAPGEQSWTFCRSRDSKPQPWVTSGFKSNALSIRPTTANLLLIHFHFLWTPITVSTVNTSTYVKQLHSSIYFNVNVLFCFYSFLHHLQRLVSLFNLVSTSIFYPTQSF